MKSERFAVLKSDLVLAAIMFGTGVISGGIEALQAVPLVAVTMSVHVAISLYIAEHDSIPGVYPEVATLASFLIVIAVGVAFVFVLSDPLDIVTAAALTAGGIGIVGYRTIFGLLLPVPTYRLEKQQ